MYVKYSKVAKERGGAGETTSCKRGKQEIELNFG